MLMVKSDPLRFEPFVVGDDYPIHDNDYHLEFVLGMWFNTREIAGKPTVREMRATLPDWPQDRFRELRTRLERHGQIEAK